ncbi:MAG: hypothetical protein JST35_09655 [Armatimonadetes bacterium]|nr:hypothetical protein [Armatimonadota bacterium]
MRISAVLGIFAFAALVIIGCGGGGSSSTGTPGGDGGDPIVSAINIEAIHVPTGKPIDPLQLQAGDSIRFEAAGYTASGSRRVVSATGWATTDVGNSAGTLSGSGNYSASSANATTFTVSATESFGSSVVTRQYKVLAPSARILGKVVDTNNNPASGITVVFFDSSLSEVGRGTTLGKGAFTARLSGSPTQMHILSSSVNTVLYFQNYFFLGQSYSTLIGTCTAPAPTVSGSSTVALNSDLALSAQRDSSGNPNPPPSPPTGCTSAP